MEYAIIGLPFNSLIFLFFIDFDFDLAGINTQNNSLFILFCQPMK